MRRLIGKYYILAQQIIDKQKISVLLIDSFYTSGGDVANMRKYFIWINISLNDVNVSNSDFHC